MRYQISSFSLAFVVVPAAVGGTGYDIGLYDTATYG